jgi:hypothetical protein
MDAVKSAKFAAAEPASCQVCVLKTAARKMAATELPSAEVPAS